MSVTTSIIICSSLAGILFGFLLAWAVLCVNDNDINKQLKQPL